MFEEEERTEHKHIAPARERIKQYRVRKIPTRMGQSAISHAAIPPRQGLKGAKSTSNIHSKVGLSGAERPITAGVGSSVATAAFTNMPEDARSGIQAAMNARAISVSRFTNFEEQERAIKKHPFPAFSVKQDPF